MIKGSDNLRFRYKGPVPAPHICGIALKCLAVLKRNLSFQKLQQGASNHVLPDGTHISCRTCWGADNILVTTPFQPPVPGESLPVKKYKCTEFFGFYLFYTTPQERLTIQYDKDSPALFQAGETLQAGLYSRTIAVIKGRYIAGDFPVQIETGMTATGKSSGAIATITGAVKRHCRMLYTVKEVISNIAADILPENNPDAVAANIISPVEFPPTSDTPFSDTTNVPNPVMQTKVLDHISVTAFQHGDVNNILGQKWSIAATVDGQAASFDGEDYIGENNYYIVRGYQTDVTRYNFDVWKNGLDYYISLCGESVETPLFVYKLVKDHFELHKIRESLYNPGYDPYKKNRCLLSKDMRYWYFPGRDTFYAIEDSENTISNTPVDGTLLYLDINPVTRYIFTVTSQAATVEAKDPYIIFRPQKATRYFNPGCVFEYDGITLALLWTNCNRTLEMNGKWYTGVRQGFEFQYFLPEGIPYSAATWYHTIRQINNASVIYYNNIKIGSYAINRGARVSGVSSSNYSVAYRENGSTQTSVLGYSTINPCSLINHRNVSFLKAIPTITGTFAATYETETYPSEDFDCSNYPSPKPPVTNYTVDASIAQESGWKLVCLGSKDRNGNAVKSFIVYNSNRIVGINAATPVGQRVFATFLNVKKCREI